MELNNPWLNNFYTTLNEVQEVPRREFDKLASILRIKNLDKNNHLVMPGEEKAKIGFVVKGLFRSYILKSDGSEFNTDFCLEGYLTGSYDIFLGGAVTNQAIQALEDSILLMLDYEVFEKNFLNKNPLWQSLVRKLVQELYIMKSRREEDLLILDATERYKKFLADFKDAAQRIPQYHIASYLGITPIALCRVKKKLD